MDDLLDVMVLPPGDYWMTGLAAGYDLIASGAETLLARDFTVLVESTFTFVPLDGGPPQFHLDQVARLRALAGVIGARFDLVVLTASRAELLRRRQLTGRLWDCVVEGSARLHNKMGPQLGSVPIDTTALDLGRVVELAGRQLQLPAALAT
jgi:hypothetical protein